MTGAFTKRQKRAVRVVPYENNSHYGRRGLLRGIIIVSLLIATTGVLSPQAYQGYTLFGPNNSRYTYLCNMNNQIVKTWTHSKSGGYSAYLLSDGSVIRTASSGSSSINGGGAQGVVQKYNWAGSLTWEYTYSTTTVRAHHDICPMPNGNVLLIAWEVKTAAQAVAAGLNRSSVIWPDHVIEVQPVGTNGGNIVWKWHAWDHLVQQYDPTKANYGIIADHPELLNINMGATGMGGGGDWMHINGISYNPELDQIVISSHTLNEIYVIDHSTTTAQAASHQGGRSGRGGDILYRWGMPSNYGAPGAQVFKVVHCAKWVPAGLPGAGNILAFNNRENQGSSMVVELTLPLDTAGKYIWTPGSAYAPTTPVWSYTAAGFYSNHLGGLQRLPNGNTLIVESTSGYLFETDAAGNTVWSYNRGGEVVRALRYGFDYPGLSAITSVKNESPAEPRELQLRQNYPNPFNPSTEIRFSLTATVSAKLTVFNSLGTEIAVLFDGAAESGKEYTVNFNTAGFPSGIFFYRLSSGNLSVTKSMVCMK